MAAATLTDEYSISTSENEAFMLQLISYAYVSCIFNLDTHYSVVH
jgi:hypothetical protein